MAWFRTKRAPNGDAQISVYERALRMFRWVEPSEPLFGPDDLPWTMEDYEKSVAGEVPKEPCGPLLPWYRRLLQRKPREQPAPPTRITTYRGE